MVKQNTKKHELMFLALLVLASVPASAPLFAQTSGYGQDILTAGISIYTWLRRLGIATTLIGLGWGGIKITVQHDTQHLKGPMFTALGGVICLMAPSIVNLIAGIAPSASVTP